MSDRTPLQAAAQRVWESLLCAQGHLGDLREVDGGEDPYHRIDRLLESLFSEVADFMHEDDCHD